MKTVNLTMTKIKIVFLLTSIIIISNYSCVRCKNTFYIFKYYIYPNLKIKLEVNDKVVYDKINMDYIIPDPYKVKRYCPDLCLDEIKSPLIKIYYKVNDTDTLLYLDSKKIGGVYLGYEIGVNKMNVIVDSIGKGLDWGGKPTGFD